MIDNHQIQKMLQVMNMFTKNAKLTSITDIITFVVNHVFQETTKPLEMLEERIFELERPKGMDRIMLQEVKTLVDAMIEQRQQQLKHQLQRKYRDNIHSSFDVQNSRRSLNQIDFINIINMQNGTQSQQLRKTNSNFLPHLTNKNDIFMNQIKQLRQQLQKKPQRRQFQDLKSSLTSLSKDLVSKINFQQTEKLILKFQKDIFLKLSQTKGYTDEIQSKMTKQLQNEIDFIKKQCIDPIKTKPLNKIQKKLKKHGQQLQILEQNMNNYKINVMQYKNQCIKYQKNSLEDIQNMQGLIQQINQERQALLLKQSKCQSGNTVNTALWIAAPPAYKNSYVVWEREIFNNDKNNIQFQSGKTNIRLVNAGFYQISCAVYGGNGNMKKGPIILCNSEQIGRLQMKMSNCQSLPRWFFKQLVYIKQNRSTLTLRFQSQQNSSCILFWINKFSY